MIDTHCHLTDPRLLGQVDGVIARANAARVSHLIAIGTDIEDDQKVIAVCKGRDAVRCAIGIHPNHCAKAEVTDLDLLRTVVLAPSVIALGEMGLDYHYPPVDRAYQALFFQRQLELAVERHLPVVIHCREAVDDTLAILQNFPAIRGVFHCFTGTLPEAMRILDAGYYLGFDGPVTFKKSDALREVVKAAPTDRLLIETDSPYLSPEPFRNQKINEPALVVHVAARIAAERGITIEELDDLTSANAARLFGWPIR